MCGIVGAIAQRDVAAILLDGLKRLEYRGYDSAGVAILASSDQQIQRIRAAGKVTKLEQALAKQPLLGTTGIAHTRWATHGEPSERNAHPHMSGDDIALVHNGIIENHQELRQQLSEQGYPFNSDTDTEVIAHCIHQQLQAGVDLLVAVQRTVSELRGAYALGIIHSTEAGRIIAVRSGSPLVVGIGIKEYFIASDALALNMVAEQFIYLEEGDVVDIKVDGVTIYTAAGQQVERPIQSRPQQRDNIDRGKYRHFMQKEIFEQPMVVNEALEGRLRGDHVAKDAFGFHAEKIFPNITNITIVACGTSYHAGLVARYWFEALAGIPCKVEVASEIRYRKTIISPNTLFVAISQSGETADTLAALRQAKQQAYTATLGICNVPHSTLAREADMVFFTRAGVEIGVASTKAFTTQLVALMMLTILLGKHKQLTDDKEIHLVSQLKRLPHLIAEILALDKTIEQIATRFADKHHALFLGRGSHYPIAMEGALKLKEISYIHAEAYPAGELKHGPLALVDNDMPIVAVAPNDELLEKLISNLHEVRARGGELTVFADRNIDMQDSPGVHIQPMPVIEKETAPILYTIPLQLLAYHAAVLKGTDIDQPRNLAKSVTVE